MADLITKLDDLLWISGRERLDHADKISAEAVRGKAEQEYGRHQALQAAKPRAIDAELEKTAKQMEKAPPPKRAKKR